MRLNKKQIAVMLIGLLLSISISAFLALLDFCGPTYISDGYTPILLGPSVIFFSLENLSKLVIPIWIVFGILCGLLKSPKPIERNGQARLGR